MPDTYRSYVLNEYPKGHIVPSRTFRQEVHPIPTEADLNDGQVLVEILYLSFDPAMRVWINDGSQSRTYTEPVKPGELMRGGTVSRVIATRSKRFSTGDLIYHFTGWREYAVLDDSAIGPQLALPSSAEPSDLLGVLGLTGFTAMCGLERIADIHPGDVVVVSSAAGSTGSIVGQVAKILGAGKVIGITGTDDKCAWLTEELGFDVALNYKAPDFAKRLEAETPNWINVYWDNVGGKILDLCLGRAARFARFVACGTINEYNNESSTEERWGPPNYDQVLAQRIKFQGFVVSDHPELIPGWQQQLAVWLEEGKIKRGQTIVRGGIEEFGQAWEKLFSGANKGKLYLEIKAP